MDNNRKLIKMKKFEYVDGKWIKNWFSNFVYYEVPMEHEGIIYDTPEHFYQAMKCLEKKHRIIIAQAPTPGISKRLAKKLPLRPDWDEVKVRVMIRAIRHRLIYEDAWTEKLMATGKEEIVEWNNWHDKIWGKCICPKCGGNGTNLLGEVLMEIRTTLNELEVP